MEYQEHFNNIAQMFFARAKQQPNSIFMEEYDGNVWHKLTWQQAETEVLAIAAGLLNHGIKPKDRVIIVAENSMNWGLVDLAIMAIGAYSTPTYTTNTPRDNRHIVDDSGSVAAFVSTKELLQNFLPAAINATNLNLVITMKDPDLSQAIGVEISTLDDIKDYDENKHKEVLDITSQIAAEETACIIYTSGTGGAPKGVMQSHKSLLHNCKGVTKLFTTYSKSSSNSLSFLSILPLSHAYEHTVGFLVPIYHRSNIYYPKGIENLSYALQEKRPDVLLAVPRLFDVIKAKIEKQLSRQKPSKQKLFHKARLINLKKSRKERLSFWEFLLFPILKKLVIDKLQYKFGNLVLFVSGGAPLDKELGEWMLSIGFPIFQGYGQTETAPIISVNNPHNPKVNAAGYPIDNTNVKLGDDNELMVQGDLLMNGYWNNKNMTNKTIIDGWLHTGDCAKIDNDGLITITGRIKDIIVLSGGDNVSPTKIEGILSLEKEISQIVIYGDKKPHLTALVVPDEAWLKEWCDLNNSTYSSLDALYKNKKLTRDIMSVISKANKNFPIPDKIKKIHLSPEAFTIQNGMLTPTLKTRRHIIIEKYKSLLEGLYN